MKELENFNRTSTETKAVKPINKTKVWKASLHPQRGHKCFEINNDTHEINEVVYEESVIEFKTISEQPYVKRKIMIKENCTYITALNKKNALKKFKSK